MDRKDLLNLGFNRAGDLVLSNPEYLKWVKRFTQDVLEQDLGERGDITTEAIFTGKTYPAKALVTVREDGVIAGIEELRWFYERNGVEVKQFKRSGDHVKNGEAVLELTGTMERLLQLERTGLKILQRMSGIATMTSELIEMVKEAGAETMVAATRKTHWQLLDKKAVHLGGGGTHRLGLWESILIKDNHLEGLKREGFEEDYVEEALKRAWRNREKTVFIEIEVENETDALRAARIFKKLQQQDGVKPCVIMLDNMFPEKIRKVIRELKEQGLYDYVLLEASGGISPENLIEYAKTGVDVVSLGSITHSPKALDINQTLVFY